MGRHLRDSRTIVNVIGLCGPALDCNRVLLGLIGRHGFSATGAALIKQQATLHFLCAPNARVDQQYWLVQSCPQMGLYSALFQDADLI